jgi:hypothetical protein
MLLSATDIARMRRVPLDTIPVHVEPIDNIIYGPSVRLVVTRADYLPAAWTLAGARGTPPMVDFNNDAVILIGTAVHDGTWSVRADSLYAADHHLFVLAHEHTKCALIDISARGTLPIRISASLARYVTFIERSEDTRGGHEAV